MVINHYSKEAEMPHFLFRRKKKFSVNFEELGDESVPEIPFWEIQRNEAVDILITFFSSWQADWARVKQNLGNLNFAPEDAERLDYYEAEQKKTALHHAAEMLAAWERDDEYSFSHAVYNLAKELRPSLYHFEDGEAYTNALNSHQRDMLRNFTGYEAQSLKATVANLQKLAWRKFEFGDKVITISSAERLLEEKLGLTYFEFLDFKEEPEFNGHGFFPALLQESTDFNL